MLIDVGFNTDEQKEELTVFRGKSHLIHRKGGGGGGGKVDFPEHMKAAHADWLDDTGTDTMTYSIVSLMDAAMAVDSPYIGYVPKDPDEAFFAAGNSLSDYSSAYEQLKSFDDWDLDAAYDGYIVEDESKIAAAVFAHSALLDDEISSNALPKFKAGMVNLNATMSSAFVVGEAMIYDSKVKKVAETDANIRLKRLNDGADLALRRVGTYAEWRKTITTMTGELSRIYLVASGERDDDYLEGLHKNATWDMEMYQYGTQVMASISGTASTSGPRTSKTASAIGGVMSGAATGAMLAGASSGAVGGPAGMAVGAGLGLAAALF